MRVPEAWVNDYKEEIEREALRLHNLRKVFAPSVDNPYDNFVTACSNIFRRHGCPQIK
jgi:hypothetical protein